MPTTTTETIEYTVTLRVTVPARQPDDVPRPFENRFYDACAGTVAVTRARRETLPVSMGGPR
jgi:hypothetical protein